MGQVSNAQSIGCEVWCGTRTVVETHVICISIDIRGNGRTISAPMPILRGVEVERRWLYGILAKVEIEKLGVCEESKVVGVESRILGLWILRRRCVQVGNVLRYVWAPPLRKGRHDARSEWPAGQ